MKKKILLLATGGTIACKKEQDGLKPELDCSELLSYLDDLSKICDVDCIQLFNLDSTNMTYAASCLSYMIQNSPKPIVFTGSQKSIYMRDNDARNNLTNALLFASNDSAYGVTLVFDNKVILGTRAKKIRSKSYNAFTSVNYPAIASINDKRILFYIKKHYKKEDLKFYFHFDTNVFLLKLIPSLDIKALQFALSNFDVILIEGFGVGGLPDYFGEIYQQLKDKIVIISTQVQFEGSDLDVYQVGKSIKEKYDLLESYDMTSESLLSKIMWILSITKDKKEVKKLLYKEVYSDILR